MMLLYSVILDVERQFQPFKGFFSSLLLFKGNHETDSITNKFSVGEKVEYI